MNKRVVIVEDEFFVAKHLEKMLVANGYTIIGKYHDGETLMENLPFIHSAIFLLDIQLSSSVTGVDIATELNKRNLPFLYITANAGDNTFADAINTSPVAFISKPFKEIDVLAGVVLASQRLNTKISIDSGKEKVLINPDEVLYIKSDGVYIELFLENGSTLNIRKQLKTMDCELSNNFKRCHKSFIVNRDKVTHIKGACIYLDTIKVPLSKTYRDNFS